MPYIPRPVKHDRQTLNIRLDREQSETLKQYAEFLSSTRDYVIDRALRMVFSRDKEFMLWRTSHGITVTARSTIDVGRDDGFQRMVPPPARNAQEVP
jgi:hypothetical protein